MKKRGYKHLGDRERLLIEQLRAKNFNQTEIALRIGRDKSTVSRELQRNAEVETPQRRFFHLRVQKLWSEEQRDAYLVTRPAEDRETIRVWEWKEAQQIAEERAWKAAQKRRCKTPETRAWIIEKLGLDWSPEQIAGRSKLERACEDVSHEYVYGLVRRDRQRGGALHRLLKRSGRRKQRFGRREYNRNPGLGRTSIEKRPAIVARRTRLEHRSRNSPPLSRLAARLAGNHSNFDRLPESIDAGAAR